MAAVRCAVRHWTWPVPFRKPGPTVTCMSWWDRRRKNVVMGPITTNAARGARPSRRIWPRSHSGLGPLTGKNLMSWGYRRW